MGCVNTKNFRWNNIISQNNIISLRAFAVNLLRMLGNRLRHQSTQVDAEDIRRRYRYADIEYKPHAGRVRND